MNQEREAELSLSLLPRSNQRRSGGSGLCTAGQILLLLRQEHESQEGSLLLSPQRKPRNALSPRQGMGGSVLGFEKPADKRCE